LSNQPASFYFGTGLDSLFSSPARPAFANQFLPTFYADTWGDYWYYYLVYGVDTRGNPPYYVYGEGLEALISPGPAPVWLDTNQPAMIRYLGMLNLAALIPSGLACAALLLGLLQVARLAFNRGVTAHTVWRALLSLAVWVSFAGFAWFLILYPSPGKGDTIKATYMLQTFPLVAVLAGDLLAGVADRHPRLYRAIAIAIALVVVIALPACISRFTALP
jgi:hypothetical protein